MFIFIGCGSSVSVPLGNTNTKKMTNIKDSLNIYPKDKIERQTLLDKKLLFPAVGDLNSYDITVTPELEIAYHNYLGGDGKKALNALSKIEKNSKDVKLLWQVQMLKMKVFIMMGLGDDALAEYENCQKYEQLTFNATLNCRAQRGETYVWTGDFVNAKIDLESVLFDIGEWELPTSYMAPPSNMPELVAVTTAQLRSYTSLAAMYTLQENYEEAYYWAYEADKRYNSLLYVSTHWLYGKFLRLHLDTYYGNATNLTFLASAELAKGMSEKAEQDFKSATEFYDKISYAKGKATVLALNARVLNRIGEYDKCSEAGAVALEYSLQNGFLDFVWRIEALRGETFEKLHQSDKAHAAYKRAAETINLLSSSLSSDSSKRKFGYSKDDITLALMRYDIQNKDYEQLFVDAEEGRARAFVETLSTRTIDRKNPLLKEIYSVDKEINKQLILNTAIESNSEDGVKKLNELLEQKKRAQRELRSEDETLASVVSVWTSSLKETQSSLGTNDLIYLLTTSKDEAISYLKISSDDYSFHTLSISNEELKNDLKELSTLLGINTIQTRGLKNTLKRNAISKPDKIAVINKKLSKIFNIASLSENVYLVASNDANFIPWGMLEVDFTPMLLPTASWLNLKSINIDSKKTVVLGNPNFGTKAPQLEGASAEAKSVAKLYNTEALLFNDATEAKLRKEVEDGVNILHLATHGVFYKNQALKSALLLTDGKSATELSADEIFTSPLKSNLVVLSACESGLGESASANDYLGLSRSFFLGGSKAVLSSLWAIDDEGTKEFMEIFHKSAKNGDYVEGYKNARNSLKEKGYSPTIYGAFILQGISKL